jgi:hypothetical protein
MVAMAGFFTQAFVTHDGPYANLLAHISDPGELFTPAGHYSCQL